MSCVLVAVLLFTTLLNFCRSQRIQFMTIVPLLPMNDGGNGNYPKVLSNYTSVYLALLFKHPNDAPIYSKPHICKFLTVFQSATGSSRCACNPNQRQVRLTALVVLCKTDPRGWDTTPREGEAQGTECTYAFVLQVVYQL